MILTLGVFINNDAFSLDHSGITAGQLLKPEGFIMLFVVVALMKDRAPIPDLIDKKECDKIERKRRVWNERTKT